MIYGRKHFSQSDNERLTKGAIPIPSKHSYDFLKNLNINLDDVLFDYDLAERYKTKYVDWITSSKRNNLQGLEKFTWRTHTNGTIESFGQFIAEHHKRRFRCFKAEFVLHRLNFRNNDIEFKFLEDGDIEKNDAVIISVPFSDLGNVHYLTRQIIQQCNKLDVPVLIDCAYMVIAKNIDFNFDQPCIKVITFSLSKGFWGLDKLRIGIRLQREDTDDPITVCNKWNTLNMMSMYIGEKVFDTFDVDWLWDTYTESYKNICDRFELEHTNCILFGIGSNEYDDFSRGGNVNRVCVSNSLSDINENN